MRDRYRALAGFLSLLTVLLVPSLTQAAQRQGHISGKVVNVDNQPIPDVKVTITTKASAKFKKELTTGKDGSYETFLNDATVSYHYRFEKAGFVTVETDKKVPIWNPSEESGVYPGSASMSVLNVQLVAQPAAEPGR